MESLLAWSSWSGLRVVWRAVPTQSASSPSNSLREMMRLKHAIGGRRARAFESLSLQRCVYQHAAPSHGIWNSAAEG